VGPLGVHVHEGPLLGMTRRSGQVPADCRAGSLQHQQRGMRHVAAALTALVAGAGLRLPPAVVGRAAIAFAAGCALLGLFNGVFVDATAVPAPAKRRFSPSDALVGMGICVVGAPLYALAGPNVPALPTSGGAVLAYTGAAALFGLGAGGIWRFINRSPSRAGGRPPLFSGKGFLIGCLTATLLPLAVIAVTLLARPASAEEIPLRLWLLTIGLACAGGGVTGGISRYVFWWANALPAHHMEIIGIWLICMAFLAQAVEPTLRFFDVAVR